MQPLKMKQAYGAFHRVMRETGNAAKATSEFYRIKKMVDSGWRTNIDKERAEEIREKHNDKVIDIT